jgi:hypothetical protein
MFSFTQKFFDIEYRSNESQIESGNSYISKSQPSDQTVANSNYIRYVQKCGAPISGMCANYYTR